jgi:hypothetical protein
MVNKENLNRAGCVVTAAALHFASSCYRCLPTVGRKLTSTSAPFEAESLEIRSNWSCESL